MKNITYLFMFAAITFLALIMCGCVVENDSVDAAQKHQSEQIQDRLNSQLGLPNIQNGHEKRLVKELYELRDQANLIAYTYTFSELNGEFRFLGKSIGFGISESIQYSNPQKIVKPFTNRYEFTILPQAEPNGLFMPEGLSATWVYLIDPATGTPNPTYVEPILTVSLHPLPNAIYPEGGPQYSDLIAK